MSRIFLSHSSKNNDSAVALRDWLATQGWDDVFLDLDPRSGIAAGERWERALNQAALRCDEARILSWSDDDTLRLWNVPTGDQIGPAMKHEGDINGALLMRRDSRILSWSDDHTLRLWDTATGRQIGPAMKHEGSVVGALVTRDETHILSWSVDHTLRLWDAGTGQLAGPAMKHDDEVKGALLLRFPYPVVVLRPHAPTVGCDNWPTD
jgi:WD40 repeat protein